ncbi:MAG TPA: type II secretion system protein [Candidatus Paceibacterota bacterium]|nr:type II secretion system protein [Candidatus Paceibacterota bacterium]
MRKGFTLIELIVVVGIMLAVSAVVFSNLAGERTEADLTATTQQVTTLLREAQTDAMTQENNSQAVDAAWGVHFSNATATAPFYALFTGSYSQSSTVSSYPLLSTVAYQTSTLPAGATLDVIFSPVTGFPSASATIGFYMPKENTAFSSTIVVAPTGAVSY